MERHIEQACYSTEHTPREGTEPQLSGREVVTGIEEMKARLSNIEKALTTRVDSKKDYDTNITWLRKQTNDCVIEISELRSSRLGDNIKNIGRTHKDVYIELYKNLIETGAPDFPSIRNALNRGTSIDGVAIIEEAIRYNFLGGLWLVAKGSLERHRRRYSKEAIQPTSQSAEG